MPIVIRYDSPALVAASAAGVGNQRAQETQFEQTLAAQGQGNALALNMAGQAQHRREFDANQMNRADGLALDAYGQQLGQFNADRNFNAGQQRYNDQRQLNAGQIEQAVTQVRTMASMGQLDPATAERWIGIAQKGGNPFAERSTTETLDNEQRQLAARQQLAAQQGDIRTNAIDQQFGNQVALQGVRDQGATARNDADNVAALERAQMTQQAIGQRQQTSGNSPAQQRLAANDTFNRQLTAARASLDAEKNDLEQVDTAIKSIAAASNPLRAADPRNQGQLDQLHALRGTINADGSSTGILGRLSAAQRALQDAAGAPAPNAAPPGQPTTSPAAAASSAVVEVGDETGYARLPRGTQYRHPDGSIRMKQ